MKKFFAALRLLLIFIRAIIASGVDTLRVILRHGMGQPLPPARFVTLPFAPMSEMGASLLASMITLTPGTTTAIIGSTGSGKTTLISLVPRLFDATEGSVLVDGVDVRELDPDTLWARIGLVPQKPYLFSGTIASNLRYGKPDATDQ